MWRRTYLGLVLLRLYFALSPSYLHPDEHFQGPEVIAGELKPPLPIVLDHNRLLRPSPWIPSQAHLGVLL